MDRTSHRLGGIVLVVAALAGLVGGLLHGPQPGTLEAYGELGTAWTVSHLGIATAGAFFVVASLFLLRGFQGSPGEGWVLAGAGLLVVGGVALLGVGAIETAGFSGLAGAAEGGNAVGAGHGFLAATAVMTSLATSAGFLIPAAVAGIGVGVLRHGDWPGWLGWLGVILGLAVLALQVSGVTVPGVPALPLYLQNAWFAVVGVVFFRLGSPSDAAPASTPVREEPARPEPTHQERTPGPLR